MFMDNHSESYFLCTLHPLWIAFGVSLVQYCTVELYYFCVQRYMLELGSWLFHTRTQTYVCCVIRDSVVWLSRVFFMLKFGGRYWSFVHEITYVLFLKLIKLCFLHYYFFQFFWCWACEGQVPNMALRLLKVTCYVSFWVVWMDFIVVHLSTV